MKTKSFIHALGLTLVWGVWLSGCVAPPAASNGPAATHPNTTPENFQGSASGMPTAVQSAIELSQKCAQLSEQLTALREERRTLATENDQFKGQIADLEPKLQQAQKELGEANDLLMEMRLELNNWQNDVLGFRAEMRDADQAQLEALLKILMLLGGEVTPETPDTMTNPNNPAVSDPNV